LNKIDLKNNLILWFIISVSFLVTLYQKETSYLFVKAFQILKGDIGTSYPLAGIVLISFFLFLRRSNIKEALEKQNPLNSHIIIRLIGLTLIFLPKIFSMGIESHDRTVYLPLSSAIIMLLIYGSALTVSPKSLRILTPYLILGVTSVLSPLFLNDVMGLHLSLIVTNLVKGLTWLFRIPVSWMGTYAYITTVNGESIYTNISPGCSSISSISTFLLLTLLMHMDLQHEPKTTLKLSTFGTLVLILLNSMRITILIFSGYVAGPQLFNLLHKRLGYLIFTSFYIIALIIYLKPLKTRSATSQKYSGEEINPY
jgi:exosortase/archaeosortase family protein